jgi:hypothetical protein
MKHRNFLGIFLMVGLAVIVGAGAAHAAGDYGDPCTLVVSLQGVFKTLRTLAFAGAAFCVGGWAWTFISGGDAKLDVLKGKGIALLVGFALLFGVGMVLQFLPGISGCPTAYNGW